MNNEEAKEQQPDSDYITIHPVAGMTTWRAFFRDFPYSLLQQRRKPPGEKKHKLVGQNDINHSFEEYFWDFDNKWIANIQQNRGKANSMFAPPR